MEFKFSVTLSLKAWLIPFFICSKEIRKPECLLEARGTVESPRNVWHISDRKGRFRLTGKVAIELILTRKERRRRRK